MHFSKMPHFEPSGRYRALVAEIEEYKREATATGKGLLG